MIAKICLADLRILYIFNNYIDLYYLACYLESRSASLLIASQRSFLERSGKKRFRRKTTFVRRRNLNEENE